MARDPAAFAIAALENEGAVAERGEDGSAAVLLPAALARRLERPEEYCFRTETSAPSSAEVITYGSEVLMKIAELAQARGRTSHAIVPVGYLKKADLEPLARDVLQVSRASRKFGAAEEALVSYALVNIRYRAVSVETREGLLSFGLNETSGALVDGLGAAVDPADLADAPAEEPIDGRLPIDRILGRAAALARRHIEEQLAGFRAAMERRLARDWRRTHEYYAALRDETRRRLRRSSVEATRERCTAKLAAIDADVEAKRRDVLARYVIRVNTEVASVLRLYLIGLKISCWLQHRERERTIATFWNPLTKTLEPLFCEACHQTVRAFVACDRLHLVCGACTSTCPTCGRRLCGACHPRGCPTCAAKNEASTGEGDRYP
jgi:hypothetical protein